MIKKKKGKNKSSSLTFGGISEKYERKEKRIRHSYMTKEQRKYAKDVEKPSLQEALQKLKKEKREDQLNRVGKVVGRVGKRLFGQKFLKRPTAKLPKHSAKKILLSTSTGNKLVTEGRTGYFNEEWEGESRWF